MTLTKKHFIALAKISASIQEVCNNKSKEENELTAITHHALYEIKSFCQNNGNNFDSYRFDNYIKEELERREIQKEKRRLKNFDNAVKMLHNSQFGVGFNNKMQDAVATLKEDKPKKHFTDNSYVKFKWDLK